VTSVGLVFGGANSEHAVSCSSAAAVGVGLRDAGHEVVFIGVDRTGRFHRVDSVGQLDSVGAGTMFPDLDEVDLVFPALHGRFGEDGTLQGLLETVGVPYVGCGVLASALAMDKRAAARTLAAAGVPVVAGSSVTRRDRSLAAAHAELIGYPLFVKPNRAGSSVGATRVQSRRELRAAIDAALDEDERALLQPLVRGVEVDVGILELPDGRIMVGAPLAIRPPSSAPFFDYAAKYSGEAEFEVPALLPVDVTVRLVELAELAFRTLGCAGLARVDFFVETDGTIILNEVNTMPGLTEHSQFPRMFAGVGMPFTEMLSTLVATALRRSQESGREARRPVRSGGVRDT
jgi:D-alanine-D-alanine ligase